MNKTIRDDIEELISNKTIYERFENQNVMITGATGLIGSLLVKSLIAYSKKSNIPIKVIALVRNMDKAEMKFKDFLCDQLEIVKQDIIEPIEYSGTIDYLIHAASITASKSFVNEPVETIETAIYGTNNILKLAKQKKVKSIVYLSSLEVYGASENSRQISYLTEFDYGYIDPLNIRSSYSEGKRMVENLCISYMSEYQLPIKIARLTQTFGAGVTYEDPRVFAEFARCVLEERDIILHTKGETIRNYCYTTDAVKAILYILLMGSDGNAYNVANEETTVSIYEMAKLMAKYSLKAIQVIIEEEEASNNGYNPTMQVSLVNDKLKQLGWSAQYDLNNMIKRLIGSMQEDFRKQSKDN